jgi:DNA-binding CsgD family transcriptional regulator
MTDTANGKATTLAAGMLSLDYLNSLFLDHAGLGALYAIASEVQWATFASAAGPEQAAAAVNLIASAYAAYKTQAPAAADREGTGATRRGAKNPVAAKLSGELSDREKACLSWAAVGKSSWEIGRILCISENTAIFHIKNAMRKLGTNSRTLAAFRAVELGLIEPAVEPGPQVVRRASGP